MRSAQMKHALAMICGVTAGLGASQFANGSVGLGGFLLSVAIMCALFRAILAGPRS